MPNWLFQLAAALLLALAALLLYLSLFRDRPRGRRRCPRCWYELAPPSLFCPECGHTARSERCTRKTRRRWRRSAFVPMALLLAYAAHLTPAVRNHGLIPSLPTSILILLPFHATDCMCEVSSPNSHAWEPTLWTTLRYRERTRGIAPWQRWILTRRFNAAWSHRDWTSARTSFRSALPRLDAHVTTHPGDTIDQVAAAITQATGLPVMNDLPDHCSKLLINIDSRTRSARFILDELPTLLGEYGVVWIPSAHGIRITLCRRAFDEDSLAHAYDVRDITRIPRCSPACEADQDRTQALVDLITLMLAPDEWTRNGGTTASIGQLRGRLFVVGSANVHNEIESLLDGLRDPRSHTTNFRGALDAPIRDALRTLRAARVSSPPEGLTMRQLTDTLKSKHSLSLLCDLLHPPTALPYDINIGAASATAAHALDRIKSQCPYVAWTIDAETILVTTDQATPLQTLVYELQALTEPPWCEQPDPQRFYCFPPPPCDRLESYLGLEMKELIRNNVDMDHWFEHGGTLGRIESFGNRLVIRTTTPNHCDIQDLLSRLVPLARREAASYAADIADVEFPPPTPVFSYIHAEDARHEGMLPKLRRFHHRARPLPEITDAHEASN